MDQSLIIHTGQNKSFEQDADETLHIESSEESGSQNALEDDRVLDIVSLSDSDDEKNSSSNDLDYSTVEASCQSGWSKILSNMVEI